MIIGFVGIEGSGKDTATDYMCNKYGFKTDSFAYAVKDVCSSVFGWDRELLEGKTPESRKWRESVDDWWANELMIENFTPRMAMRVIGTDVFRNNFNQNIWISSLKRRLLCNNNNNIIISDLRFENEIRFVMSIGKVYLIDRRNDPEWLLYAKGLRYIHSMATLRPDVHQSNWDWLKIPNLPVIENVGTIGDLYQNIDNVFEKLL